MPKPTRSTPPEPDLLAVQHEITALVTRNAVSMVQHAIDSVHEAGQYQAIKYLFEMIGLYPASGDDEAPGESSLAATLLQQLGVEVADKQQSHEK